MPVPGIPLVEPGADLVAIVSGCLARAGLELRNGDVLVVAQKIVSKAEGRRVDLASVEPSAQAERLATKLDKDPRVIEVILSESRRVVRAERNVLILEHRLGFVMANAGVDQSNVGPESEASALMLPRDPDGSAERLRAGLEGHWKVRLGVVINDSFGRPWRRGVTGVAIGAAGVDTLIDKRGAPDLFGRPLKVTVIAHADEIAAAASLVMGQADEGVPVVLVRGLPVATTPQPVTSLVRPPEEDLFR